MVFSTLGDQCERIPQTLSNPGEMTSTVVCLAEAETELPPPACHIAKPPTYPTLKDAVRNNERMDWEDLVVVVSSGKKPCVCKQNINDYLLKTL